MNDQRRVTQVLVVDAIDLDLRDAKVTISLIERLTEQNNHPETCLLTTKNCRHL